MGTGPENPVAGRCRSLALRSALASLALRATSLATFGRKAVMQLKPPSTHLRFGRLQSAPSSPGEEAFRKTLQKNEEKRKRGKRKKTRQQKKGKKKQKEEVGTGPENP